MKVEALRTLYQQGRSKQVLTACEDAAITEPEASFYASIALIDLGQEDKAKACLEATLANVQDAALEADFLALLAFLQARRGDFSGYLEHARKASQVAHTPLTLYHLGLALPDPEESFKTLRSALKLAEEKGDHHSATRNAFALSVPLLRLGRYREALHWLRYGELRCQHEGLRTALLYTRACVQLLMGETEGLETKLQEALAEREDLHPWSKEPLSTALADLYQASGRHEDALAIYRRWLAQAPRSYWPRLAHGAVRALVALNHREEARAVAETTLTVADNLPLHQAAAHLVMGTALWPEKTSRHHLETALESFCKFAVPLATEAGLHLAALHHLENNHLETHAVLAQVQTGVRELGTSGMALLGGQALMVIKPTFKQASAHKVFLFGKTEAFREGRRVAVRPRGFDLLALLLAHPQGLSEQSLNDAIYGKVSGALRVEVYRLKKAFGLEIERSPYRLKAHLESDYQEVETLLKSGRVEEAVRRYRGPLLPHSQASGVADLRTALETQLVEAVLSYGQADLVWELAQVISDDLQLWERLLELPEDDPRIHSVKGRVALLRKELL